VTATRIELMAKAAEVHDLLALEPNPQKRRMLHDLFIDDLDDLETRDREFGENATALAEAFAGAARSWSEREAHSVRVPRPSLSLIDGGAK